MKEVFGDLIKMTLQGEFDVMIQGCNCFCTMGAGFAKSVVQLFPEAYRADLATKKGDRSKLGTYTCARISRGEQQFVVVNAYTQYRYGRGGVFADYEAIRRVMRVIKRDFTGARIGYPLIGGDLAGGDWTVISQIIDEELDGENHTLVRYRR